MTRAACLLGALLAAGTAFADEPQTEAAAPAEAAAAPAAPAPATAADPAMPPPATPVAESAVKPVPPAAPAAAPGSPAAVVDEFHEAMRQNFQQGMLDALVPDVLIFEQGYLERSRDEYAGGHLHDDMKFAAQTQRRVVAREVLESGDSASVLTLSITQGKFDDREISLQNTETMVLARRDGKWKITHIHWSAHPRPAAAPPAPPKE